MCSSSKNVIIPTPPHPTPPHSCVASTMCAMIRQAQLRSIHHVFKFKECHHPHPTPPHPTHPTPPEAVHCVALWTRITLCFGHVSSMTQKSEKTMHFWEKIKRVSQLWQRQKHCSQWYECWVWVLGHTCCRNPVKRCLICPKTCVSYGEYMMKNARDQAPGRNNKGSFFHCSVVFSPSHTAIPGNLAPDTSPSHGVGRSSAPLLVMLRPERPWDLLRGEV